MLVKTVTLKDTALDWAVAKALNFEVRILTGNVYPNALRINTCAIDNPSFSPSRYQSQGAQILDDNGITTIYWECGDTSHWTAFSRSEGSYIDVHYDDGTQGSTRLEAGLRCLALFKLGPTVEIPDELVNT